MATRLCFQASLLVCAVALLVVVQPFAVAQLTTGGIVGVVTDPSGSRVPGVAVTITEVQTSTSNTVNTDADGSYNATNVRIGT